MGSVYNGLTILIVSLLYVHGSHGKLLYGCVYEPSLCDPEESCVEAGMFGRCQSEDLDPVDYSELSESELELLKLELTRMVGFGLKWHSAETQCVISYFFLTRKEHFHYDPEFCNVRNPANILELIQLTEKAALRVDMERALVNRENEISNEIPLYDNLDYEVAPEQNPALTKDYDYYTDTNKLDSQLGDSVGQQDYDYLPLVFANSDGAGNVVVEDDPMTEGDTYMDNGGEQVWDTDGIETPMKEKEAFLANVINQLLNSVSPEKNSEVDEQKQGDILYDEGTKKSTRSNDYSLTLDEEKTLNGMLLEVMNGRSPDLSLLSNEELDKFIKYVELMQSLLQEDGKTEGEVMGPYQQFDSDNERLLLKKDEEEIGNIDLGLANQEHKIVKGEGHGKPVEHSLQKIRGNRVYIHTDNDISDDTGRMMELMNYLKESVAKPNNLRFSDFQFDPHQISFDVSSGKSGDSGSVSTKWLEEIFGGTAPPKKRFSPEGLRAAAAIANNKRKMDSLVGENQIMWGGPDKRTGVAIEKKADAFVLPTLIVCSLIVGVLVSLLSVYIYRNRSRARSTLKRLAADLEGQPTKAYEELCRQRMAGKSEGPEPLGTVINTLTKRLGSQSESPTGVKSPRNSGSTSSWSEEPVTITNMDISTGHMVLSYLEEHLQNKDKFEEDWKALSSYRADLCDALVANLEENVDKNRSQTAVPYDHARLQLQSEAGDAPSEYINASPVYDADPNNPMYIVTQAPLMATASDFWQMIWEQGSVVIVNLTKLVEDGKSLCHRYWPENGSEVYGVFEVHLVSEHIWCEDYLVRSFYLKNIRTNETRTVTQFHYLSWKEGGIPASPKPLLEFRRKVNKSYRGRSCPIVVHCSDGVDRSGTYVLLDMVLNRINKGVKEIDIAATLEHLRDQRMSLVGSKDQYEFVLTCVAEEVQAIIRALPQQ